MKRGRPFEPGNKMGRGRPKGSRNKRSLLAKQLLDQHGEAIVHKALVSALQGDGAMIRTLLSLLLTRPKDLPHPIGPLAMGSLEELAHTSDTTLQKVASGKVTLSEAHEIFQLIESRRRIIETQELAQRVAALEQSPQPSTVHSLEMN